MATNRFREAIRGKGKEILSAGKQEIEEDIEEKEIQVTDSISFIADTSEEEDTYQDSVLLKKSEPVSVTGSISFEQVAEFLKGKANPNVEELRINCIKDLLNALIDHGKSMEPFFICDYKENIIYWKMAIIYSLPAKVSEKLSFYTQSRDSLSENLIVSFIKGDNIIEKIDNKDLDSYSKFNFINGSECEIISDSKFAKLVQVGFAIENKTLMGFKNFVEQFDYTKLDSDIDNCFDLFYVVNRGIENMDYSGIVHAMNFANTYTDMETRKQLLINMEHLLFEINNNVDEQLAEIVISFILKIAHDGNEKMYYTKAYRFFYQCTQTLLSAEDEDSLIKAVNFYNNIKKISSVYENTFFEYSVSEDNLRLMLNYIENSEPKFAKFYLAVTLQLLLDNKNSWRDNIPYEKFISACMVELKDHKEDIKAVIESINDDEEYFSNLMIIYFDIAKTDALSGQNDAVDFLIERIDELNKDTALEIRNYMMGSFKGYVLIFEEFKDRLSLSEDKSSFFWNYNESVFDKLKGFKEKYFTDALEYYFSIIKDSSIFSAECIKVLKLQIHSDISLSDSILEKVIGEYEKELYVGHPDEETSRDILKIVEIKEKNNIITYPDVIRLIDLGVKLEKTENRDEIKDLLQNTELNIKNISASKYCDFIDWCLNTLLNKDQARITDILNFYRNVRNLSEEGNARYSEELLSIEKLNKLKEFMDKVTTKRIQFYMLITLEYMIKSNIVWGNNGEYESFIGCCMEALTDSKLELESILNSVADNLNYFTNLLVIYYSKLAESKQPKENDALVMYFHKIQENGAEWQNDVNKILLELADGRNMMYETYKIEMDNSEGKNVFFWNYYREVFSENENYLAELFSDAAEYYLNEIRGSENYVDECIKVLNRAIIGKVKLRVDTLTRVIKEYESTLSISYPGTEWESIMKKVSDLKKENDIKTSPDILGIVEFGYTLENIDSESEALKYIHNSDINLTGIEQDGYESYIKWCMPLICSKVDFLEQSDEIKRLTYLETYDKVFSKLYNEQLFKNMSSISLSDSKEKIQNIFASLEDNIEGFSNMILLYFNQSNSQGGDSYNCVSILIDVIDRKDIEQRLKLRTYLDSLDGGRELLYAEYTVRMTEAKDRIKFFWRYCEITFDEMPEYKDAYFFKAIGFYVDSIADTEKYTEQCFRILDMFTKNGMQLEEDLLIKIIQGCEKSLRIGQPDESEKKLINTIIQIKKQTGVVTTPDIIGLINFGSRIERVQEAEEARKLITVTNLAFENIDVLRYEEFLEWVLARLLYCVNSWQIHSEIKKLLYCEKHKVIFFTKYMEILSAILERDKNEGYKIFSEFLIFFFNAKDQFGDEIIVQVRSTVSSVLSRQSDSKLRDIDNNLKAEISSMRNRDVLVREWDGILKKIQNNMRNNEKSFKGGFKLFKR